MLPLLIIDAKTTPFAFLPSLSIRVQQMVNIEGTFSGLVSFFIFLSFLVSTSGNFFRELIFPILVGAILSYAVGEIFKASIKFKWSDPYLLHGAIFIFPFAVFGLCTFLKSNGFIGVIASGITFGFFSRSLCPALFDVSKRYGKYLYQLLLIVFGVFSIHVITATFFLPALTFALCFLLGIRFIATSGSFIHTPYEWKTIGYFTLMCPKGLITISCAILFMNHLESLGLQIVVITAICPLYIHPILSILLSKSFGRHLQKNPDLYENFPTVALPY